MLNAPSFHFACKATTALIASPSCGASRSASASAMSASRLLLSACRAAPRRLSTALIGLSNRLRSCRSARNPANGRARHRAPKSWRCTTIARKSACGQSIPAAQASHLSQTDVLAAAAAFSALARLARNSSTGRNAWVRIASKRSQCFRAALRVASSRFHSSRRPVTALARPSGSRSPCSNSCAARISCSRDWSLPQRAQSRMRPSCARSRRSRRSRASGSGPVSDSAVIRCSVSSASARWPA